MKYKNEDIELIVHIRQGKFYKLSSVLSSVTWSGDIKSPSRCLEFSFIQAVNDTKIQQIGIVEGSTCCFYVGGKEIFRGTIIDIDKSNTDNRLSMTAFDIGFLLSKDQVSYNFVNTTACDIAKAVFKGKDGQHALSYGKIAPAGTKITKMFIGATRYDVIMSAYTEHSKKDKEHKKYMIEVDLDKFNIIEKGVVKLKIMFEESSNIESASYKISMNDMVSRVLVVDEKGNKVKEKIDPQLKKLYHYITKVIEQGKDKALSDDEIKNELKGPEKTCSISGFGNINCKCGYKVQVKDSFTGLVGEFYIDKDKHTWSGGKYSVDLELNFDNIMDEKEAGKDETKESSTSGVGSDWGHGITADMLNKVLKGPLAGMGNTFIKWGNAYGVNPMLVAMIIRIESRPTMDSGLALKGNNFGGINAIKGYPTITMGGRAYAKFPSVEVGIEEQFRLLGVRYIHDWKKTSIDSIIMTYAPPHENNSAGYINSLKNFYKQNTGVTWNNNLLGKGVSSKEEAHSRLKAVSSSAAISNDKQRIILQTAESMIGKGRYTWGGKTLYASDCSGFVYCCHKAAGINISGSTAGQIHDGKRVSSLSQALPGDLIVTESRASGSGRHVVLYIGNNMMIHNGGPSGRPITKEKLRLGSWHEIRRCW